MICQATYDSFESIPEALRDEFHQVSGTWRLKDSAIPGVGQLFNSALAANERKAVDQVKTRNERIRALEEQLNAANDKLATLDTPGNAVLSKEDSALWERYNKLGTPKEIEDKLGELPSLKQKVEKAEVAEAMSKIASAGGVNTEVLSDWATSPEGAGFKFFVKSVEQTDAKGAKTVTEVPYVRVEKTENGTIKVEERELLPFAKETLPEWKYNALVAAAESKGPENGNGRPAAQRAAVGGGVKIPDLGSAQNQPKADTAKQRPVDKFNEQRAARPSPFANKAAGIITPPILPTGLVRG